MDQKDWLTTIELLVSKIYLPNPKFLKLAKDQYLLKSLSLIGI